MAVNTIEQIQEPTDERLWKERGRQKGMEIHTRKSIVKIIERVKGSEPSDEVMKQIEDIRELATLESILDEIWNAQDMEKVRATINKYEWLEVMNRLDEE